MRDKGKRLLQFQAPGYIARHVDRVAKEHHSSVAGALLFIVEDYFRKVKQWPVFEQNFEAEPKNEGGTVK